MLRFFGLAKNVVDLQSFDEKKRKAAVERALRGEEETHQAA